MRPGTPGFVGARLREAREARELSAAALAGVLGISRQAISQYENDEQTPSPQVMRRLAEILRLPYHFFLMPAAEEETDIIFYRSLESAAKVSRLRAERRYSWLRKLVRYLRGTVRFPKVNFPEFDIPNDPRHIGVSDIEDIASRTRRFWGLEDLSISNLTWLVENNGAIVSRHELGSDRLDAFSQWNLADSAPYFVLGSDKGCAVRSRYDVAHELGHMILHRGLRRERFNDKAVFKLIEDQAHRFAGAFILPERSFAAEFPSTPSLDQLMAIKPNWKVSIQFMVMRCADLGIISADRKARLFANISARGWRRQEPLDDMIEVERPRLLRRSIEMLMDKHIVSASEIPFRLRLDQADVEELAGLDQGYFREHDPEPDVLEMTPTIETDDNQDNPSILRFPRTKAE
jgi:Zn-dependent peptidase ImmA (M78 family)/DNA-binding XRE family transcriptional regulator